MIKLLTPRYDKDGPNKTQCKAQPNTRKNSLTTLLSRQSYLCFLRGSEYALECFYSAHSQEAGHTSGEQTKNKNEGKNCL